MRSCARRRKNSWRSARYVFGLMSYSMLCHGGLVPFSRLGCAPALSRSQKIKQEYDGQTESNFVNADDFSDKKSIYVTIVGGLLVVAFVAPMLQFFYYTGGD